jgi:probable HAF family extracellular repeat protein
MSIPRRTPTPSRIARGAAAAAIAAASAHAGAFSTYTVVDLGPGTHAYVSRPGQGEAGEDAVGRPVHWLKSGKKVVLPSLIGEGVVHAMNAAGVMAGTVADSSAEHPVRWTADGQMQDFHQAGDLYAQVTGIDDSTTIVGYWFFTGPPTDGFVIAPDGTRTAFPRLGAGELSLPMAISPSGVIAAEADETPGGTRECVTWTGGTFTVLGVLSPGQWCVPVAINAAGHVVANAADASGQYRATLFRDGQVTDLGTLGGAWAMPSGINRKDVVVGTSNTKVGTKSAPFIWSNGKMRNLQTLLDPSAAGWTLHDTTGIGDDGRITGYGRPSNDSRDHAIVLVPVPPATPVAR